MSDSEANPLPQLRRGLRGVRMRTVANAVRLRVAASRFRFASVIGVSAIFWAMLFFFFWEGFTFLNRTQLINQTLAEFLFRLFFSSLLVMLVFSSGIILYAGLFASREAEYLLVAPTPPDHVFAFKFQEAMFFSSWGFLLLGSPMLLAYGITSGAPWHFYPFGAAFFLAFAFLPGSIGALICLFVTWFLPGRRWQALSVLAGVVLVVVAVIGWQIWLRSQGMMLTREWLSGVMDQFRIVDVAFAPARWISQGLLAASYRDADGPKAALANLGLVSINAAMAYLTTAWLYSIGYRKAYDRVHTAGQRQRRRRSGGWLQTVVSIAFRPLSPPLRVLILKDVRTFARDPVQWAQVAIFTGLLVFYLITLGRMNYYTESPYWRNLIGFFNIAVTGLIMSTFTSRFIFPLLSLEGQSFWMLGLCPVSRSQILWAKFAFAAGGSLAVTIVLSLIGIVALRLEPFLVALQFLTIVVLCCGLSGLAVGLGARFPDLRQNDPSKIAAGFGGTLNLVASLLFLLLVVSAMAYPCYLYAAASSTRPVEGDIPSLASTSRSVSLVQFRLALAGSVVFCAALGAAATLVPMRAGIRHFQRLEF